MLDSGAAEGPPRPPPLALSEELLEPHPDVHALFVHYNTLYFGGRLGACSVEWSSRRMTRCGGVCEFTRGGGCRIKLSEPLLRLRPPRDLMAVLLHEMIHADLFLRGAGGWGGGGPPPTGRRQHLTCCGGCVHAVQARATTTAQAMERRFRQS